MQLRLPLTRKNYLKLLYPEGVPDAIYPEKWVLIPPGLKDE
jgi:hypothetical protein